MPSKTQPPLLPIWIITGTPGTGKTTLAKALGKTLRARVIQEKEFVRKHRLGTYDSAAREWDVDVGKYRAALRKEIRLATRPLILEGHLLCEMRLPVKGVILLSCPAQELEKRLRARHYSEVKIWDNVMAEENNYCLTHARKNYVHTPRLRINTHSDKKVIVSRCRSWIQRQFRGHTS